MVLDFQLEDLTQVEEMRISAVLPIMSIIAYQPEFRLLSYRAGFMSKYQVLCYCSLAKPDPHTKS